MPEDAKTRLIMPLFPEIRKCDAEELERFFQSGPDPGVPEDEQAFWLDEAAIRIARSGARGVDFLLASVPGGDEARVRAALLGMSVVAKRLSARKRASICELAQALLTDERAMVVAEAVDALSGFGCPRQWNLSPLSSTTPPRMWSAAPSGSSRARPEKAVPLLERALAAKDPIVRQNAVDELDEMNYTRALPKIRRLLRDPDEGVRNAARWAVEHLEDALPGQ